MAKKPALLPGGCAAQQQTTGAYAEVVARLMAARLVCCPDEATARVVVRQIMDACFHEVRTSGQALAGAVATLVGDYIAGNTGTETTSVEQVIKKYGLTMPPPEAPGRQASDEKNLAQKYRGPGSTHPPRHHSRSTRRGR